MSLAEDLLNSLPEDQPAVAGIDPATEPHIVVNADRTVTVPEALRHIAVEGDHNIETVTFDCPRYWDGNDLSQMNLRVVYQRPDGHREPYPVKNLCADDSDTSMIHFDWTLTSNATKIRGNLSFTVCAKIADAEGIVEREWHTRLNQDLIVDEGMDCSGDEIVEQNPDILESILVRLDTLESTGGAVNPPTSNPDSEQNATLTSAQIDLLENAFDRIQWADDTGPRYAAQLIASLRGGESGGGDEEPETPAKTLQSISAVYSGGNVPVGTAVSSLTGVTVTAHYSDGSTSTVTGYTLSGTIAEGDNTITVTYMGKTTAITVTGEAQSADGRMLLHNWVLSDAEGSEIDTVGGAYANVNNGTEKTPNGYVLAGGDDVIHFSAALIAPNRTIEVDVGDVSFSMPDNENFSALCVFGDSAYPRGGKYWLCWYKPKNKWAWLDTSAGWTPTTFIDGLGAADAIAGETLKLSINSTGGLSLYIGDALLSTAPFTVVDAPYLQFGKVNEGYNRATISAVRVYQEVA